MSDEQIRLQIEKDKAVFLIIMGIVFIAIGIMYAIFFIELVKIGVIL